MKLGITLESVIIGDGDILSCSYFIMKGFNVCPLLVLSG